MKYLKIIYYLFFVCIAVIALFLIASMIPITGNYKIMIVQSGSMEPAIKMGSIVIIKPIEDYKINDIITFGPNTKTKPSITHRIYDIKVVGDQPVYITKGDINNAPDQKEITGKEIIGKVLFSVPYIGYAVDTAKKPWGFAAIIIVPALLIIFDEGKKIIREIKKIKNKKISKLEKNDKDDKEDKKN